MINTSVEVISDDTVDIESVDIELEVQVVEVNSDDGSVDVDLTFNNINGSFEIAQ